MRNTLKIISIVVVALATTACTTIEGSPGATIQQPTQTVYAEQPFVPYYTVVPYYYGGAVYYRRMLVTRPMVRPNPYAVRAAYNRPYYNPYLRNAYARNAYARNAYVRNVAPARGRAAVQVNANAGRVRVRVR